MQILLQGYANNVAPQARHAFEKQNGNHSANRWALMFALAHNGAFC